MGYSYYEVHTTAQRAFTAMGFPYGSDEDAAFIIAWLELNNFQGFNLLANILNELDHKYDGKIKFKNLKQKINFKNKSILMKGSGLIDFLISEIKNQNKFIVNIENCKNGIFFLPLLYKQTKYINLSQLIFCDINNYLNKYEIINKKIFFNRKKNNNLFIQDQVQIIMNNNKNHKNSIKKNILSEKDIQKNLSKSLVPDKNAWDQITILANKTFVPKSEESRDKGAGGGDDND